MAHGRQFVAAAAATVGTVLALAAPAEAAAPNYILVTGRSLPQPILLADWNENMRILLAVANAPGATGDAGKRLAGRPRFDLAEFWHWAGRPRPTRPAAASQHGTFYPAHRSERALIRLTVQGVTVLRVAPASVLAAFRRHGIATRR